MKHIFNHFSMMALTASLMAVSGCTSDSSQQLNRRTGLYPGNPNENFAPEIVKSRSTKRHNLALLRPAYHSSSFDYNLTAQLVTDGIITTEAPSWFNATLNGVEVSKQQRDYLLDGMPWSKLEVQGDHVVLQLDLTNRTFDVDEVKLLAKAYLTKGKPIRQVMKVSSSQDGETWRELDTSGSTISPAAGRQGNQQVADSRSIEVRCALPDASDCQHLRFELTLDAARSWELTQVNFFKGGEPRIALPSEQFCSAWRSAAAGEQWVYVDLGDRFSFDQVRLDWINRAVKGKLQVSDDAKQWQDLAELSGSEGLIDELSVKGTGRYVRLLCLESANGQPYELSEMQVMGQGGMEVIGKTPWRVQRVSEVAATGEEISTTGFDATSWIPATVPGTVLTSYLNAGAIPDPNYRDNQLQISESYFNSDFWYRTVLTADELSECTFLNFDGINWKAEIYLNGKYIDRIEGAFMRGKFDVSDCIRQGDNILAVRIIRNAHPGRVKEQTAYTADSNGGWLGADNATFHASIGWDWIPTVRGRNIGIWNDVYLTHTGAVTIEDPFVQTKLPQLPDTTVAEVNVQALVRNHASHPVKGTLCGSFGEISFEQEVELQAGEEKLLEFNPANTAALHIENPVLWWPNGYGEPHLYDVKLAFNIDGKSSDQKAFKSGIRQMTWSEEEFDSRQLGSYAPFGTSNRRLSLFVNGRRFIGFGGNWGLAEHNLNYRAREYDAAIRYHRDMNFTMIRNWVGQIGEEEFYEACDRYGVMIWQDFWLANPYDGPDPYYEDLFMANATDWIKRIRNHSSIALYVGRNEGFPPASLDTALRQLVAAEHPDIHYISHSATGVVSGGGPYRALPQKDYFELFGLERFHSERGMPNVMNYESLAECMDESDMWPINTDEHPNAMYGLHDYCLSSAQSARTFNEMMHEAFGEPKDARQFTEWAQWINYNGYRAIFEARSQDRRGLLLWMSHPAWPSMVWQTYDYYLDPTAAYFGCKKACEPLHIQWNASTNKVEVVNYRAGNQGGLTARAQLFNQDGTEQWAYEQKLDIAEDATVVCFDLPSDARVLASLTDTYFIRLSLTDAQGRKVSDNTYWRGKEHIGNYRSLRSLPQATLSLQTELAQAGDEWVLTGTVANPSDVPAMMVRLMVTSERTGERILPAMYDDNYFFLMPGESKDIRVSVKVADSHGQRPVLGCSQTDMSQDFSLGADISWSTSQEARGEQYYDAEGHAKDAFTLCREMGLDAVRLRVWVDPKEHDGHKWCDAQDVLAKALRAKAQGMDVMIDFHYSDFWADPAKQCIPAAWERHSYDEMRQDVREHTLSVLQLLKAHDIEPRWVQVGNETSNGMLWSVERDSVTGWEIKDEHGNTTITQSMGHWERNPEQYAGFFRSGAEAVKEVFPNAKVIVHLDNGFDKELYVKNLDILRRGGCKWDVVGMSLYPYWAMQGHPERTAQGVIDSTLVNIGLVAERYDCDVMIVETGFAVYDDQPEVMAEGRAQLEQIIRRARTETNGRCLGVFYWEPLCRPSQYRLGAFSEEGKPTEIMQAFKAAADHT